MSGTKSRRQSGDAGGLLFRLLHSLAIAEDGEVRCCGVTTAQGLSLLTMSEGPQISMSKVARALGVSPGTATRVIQNLVRDGLVERTGNPADRRQVRVRPTASGRKVIRKLNECYARFARAVFQAIPGNRLPRILEDLGLLVEAVEKARGVCLAAERAAGGRTVKGVQS